jgi:hypothetical protein
MFGVGYFEYNCQHYLAEQTGAVFTGGSGMSS